MRSQLNVIGIGMNTIKILQCSALCAGIMLFAALGALAQDAPNKEPEKIKVGEEYYTRGQIIEDFLNVAFSEKIWNEDAKNIESSGFSNMLSWFSSLTDEQRANIKTGMQKYAPWLAQYIYHPDSLPKQGVVNKWDGDITIGFGWPSYSAAPSIPEYHKGPPPKASYNSNPKAAELYPLIEVDIRPLLKDLQQKTGKRFTIISPDDRQDYTDQYARIRIIMVPGVVSARTWKPLVPGDWHPYQYEKYLWGGVLFESSDKDMDAYLLPNPDNRLGTVICKIRLGLDMDAVKSLARECVMRATGLPDNSMLSQNTHFAPRNNVTPSEGMTAYDKLMIGMLYCPVIKPGMDKNAVMSALFSHPECIPQLK